MMLTTDLALKMDPIYGPISKRFNEHPEEFRAAFAKAWYKLTHRDMGPVTRLLGPDVAPVQLWQDPIPQVDHPLIDAGDIAALKTQILGSGLSVPQLVSTAWASASTFRDSDKRGGANGARIRLEPQRGWEVNQPGELAEVLQTLESIQEKFNQQQAGGKRVSMADLIVLGGCAGIEQAARSGNLELEVPFTPGRMDASQEQTDVASFAPLELKADGFRNYSSGREYGQIGEVLVDRADQLALSAPEMTVLIGGLRVLNANHGGAKHGVFTDAPGVLSNDFFVNLLSMQTAWRKSASQDGVYEGVDRESGEVRWTGTAVDLMFGSNSQLRAICEVYASDDAQQKFVEDFGAAWAKVMDLDRFDLPRP